MAIKSAVYTRCGNKALYTGRSMGLYTPEESCCESDDGPIYIKPDKTDPCCVTNVLQIGTEADWAEVETTTVPLEGQIIVYTDESENLLGIKIGDGNSTLNNLPLQEFADSDEFADLKKIVEENKTAVEEQIGDLSTLTTTAKTNLVSAINEANSGVRSFNGRTGEIAPASGDYTATMVGAVANTRNAVVTTLGFYTSSNDANTAIQSGYYTLAYGASNAPSPHRNTSPMFVHAASNGVITQIVFEAVDSVIYKRGSKDKGSTWSDWQAFTAGSGSASSVNIIAPLEVETAASANSLSIAIGNGALAIAEVDYPEEGGYEDMPSIAIGNNAKAYNAYSVVIGDSAYTENSNQDDGSVAIGYGAKDTSIGASVTIGRYASTTKSSTVAIGSGASVTEYDSVAIGHSSKATEESVVSVGYKTDERDYYYRRIVNVDNPTGDHDAATKLYVDAKLALIALQADVGASTVISGAVSDALKAYYDAGLWTKDNMISANANSWITDEEYTAIVGEAPPQSSN